MSNHEKHLPKVFQVTRQQNLKLNLDKLQFKAKQATLFGVMTHQSDIGDTAILELQ